MKILVNKTKFIHHHADSMSEWTVVRARGGEAYDCKILTGEWEGAVKTFAKEEIEAAIKYQESLSQLHEQVDEFYDNLIIDNIYHYDNGFESYVRCRAVYKGKGKALLPIALVGKWSQYDLATRRQDGSIYYGYHVQKIMEKETFTPNDSCIYESDTFQKRGRKDPRQMTPVKWDLPELTEQEKITAAQWVKIQQIDDLCRNRDNPADILEKIKQLVA